MTANADHADHADTDSGSETGHSISDDQRPVSAGTDPGDAGERDDDEVVLSRSDEPVSGEAAIPEAGDGDEQETPGAKEPGLDDADVLVDDAASAPAVTPEPFGDDASAPVATPEPAAAEHDDDSVLAGQSEQIHERWAAIQASFVDNPRGSVEDAAAFLDEMMTTLVENARRRDSELRSEWDQDGLDTEGLRTIMQRYRDLLDRVAAV